MSGSKDEPPSSKVTEQLLSDLSDALEVPEGRYEAAERSYHSLGEWFRRPDSEFATREITVYPQGSFRLGTAIRPVDRVEHYDLDVVCEIKLDKNSISQAELKQQLGVEVKKYAEKYGMSIPEEGKRCWTLNYADEAQFHVDVLPAVPDGERQQPLLSALGHKSDRTSQAIGITDKDHPNFNVRSDDWPSSNPRGYSNWFRSVFQPIFDAKRRAIALKAGKVDVEEIPEYRVKTPLQATIQILKRHRDVRFVDEPDFKPISMILTTLAALAYRGETTIAEALYGILDRLDHFIQDRNGVTWIPNPTDPRENFADRWRIYPQRKTAFYEWLGIARTDFRTAKKLSDIDQLINALAPRLGRPLVESVANRQRPRGLLAGIGSAGRSLGTKIMAILDAPHRKPVLWPELGGGLVIIRSMNVTHSGFRATVRQSDEGVLAKGSDLEFEAITTVPYPFQVFWQIVNTGEDARLAND
jgi:hypothetical protein